MMWNKFKLSNKKENNNVVNVSTSSDVMYKISEDIGFIKAKITNYDTTLEDHEKRLKKLEKIVENK